MRIGNYETHPAADTFPMLSRAEFAALRDDIRDHGLRNPIALYSTQDPTLDAPPPYVLDGRNRLMACVELGLPPRFVEVTDHPFHYVISQNAKRRDMEALAKACAVQTALDAAQSWDRVVRKIRDEGNEKRSRAAQARPRLADGTLTHQSLTTLSATGESTSRQQGEVVLAPPATASRSPRRGSCEPRDPTTARRRAPFVPRTPSRAPPCRAVSRFAR